MKSETRDIVYITVAVLLLVVMAGEFVASGINLITAIKNFNNDTLFWSHIAASGGFLLGAIVTLFLTWVVAGRLDKDR